MDRLSALSNGTKLLLGAAVLLLIDTFLPWQRVEIEIEGVEIAAVSRNAWHGFWGVMLALLTIALIVWIVLQLANVAVRVDLPIPEPTLVAVVGGLIFLFALLKNLVDDYSAWASYVGLVLAAGVAIGAWMRWQEGGDATAQPERATAASRPPTEEPDRSA
jgi:hypothetical protein